MEAGSPGGTRTDIRTGAVPANAVLEGTAMNLDPPPRNLDGVREMKVKIPLRLHISLHSLKLLSGRQLSEIVTEALVAYLATQSQVKPGGEPEEPPARGWGEALRGDAGLRTAGY
jgi:hypothetical protein